MASKGYFPSKDAEVIPWVENFVQVATANAAALGLGTADITALKTKNADYSGKLNASLAKQAEAQSAIEAKNQYKDAIEDTVRAMVRQVQAKPGVPDSLKAQLKISIPSPTPAPTEPVAPKDLTVEMSSGGTCLLKWNRNSNSDRTIFVIETSNSAEKDWVFVCNSTKVSCEVKLSHPLGSNYYRVKAQRGHNVSKESNLVVI